MKVVSKGGKDWDDLLGPLQFAYRTAPYLSTGETPFSLVEDMDNVLGKGELSRRPYSQRKVNLVLHWIGQQQ